MRVDEQTLFRHEDGALIARKFLEPGSQVRTSWDYNNQERIAQEVIIVNDAGRQPAERLARGSFALPPNP